MRIKITFFDLAFLALPSYIHEKFIPSYRNEVNDDLFYISNKSFHFCSNLCFDFLCLSKLFPRIIVILLLVAQRKSQVKNMR